MIRQAADVKEMLNQALKLEQEAQASHHDVLLLVIDNQSADETALRVMLEDMVEAEQRDIDELEMRLAKRRFEVTNKEVRLTKSAVSYHCCCFSRAEDR